MSSFWSTSAGQSSGGAAARAAYADQNLLANVPVPPQVKLIRAGNSGGWHESADKGSSISEQIHDLATETLQVGSTLRAAWSGKASDAAIARLDAFGYALRNTSRTYDDNARNLRGNAEYFDYTQRNFIDVPDNPPDKALKDMGILWAIDTEAMVADYNAKQKHNNELFNKYAAHGTSSGSSLSADYGKLEGFNAGSITVGSNDPAPPVTPFRGDDGGGGKHRAPDTATAPPPGQAVASPPGGPGSPTHSGGVIPPGGTPGHAGNVPVSSPTAHDETTAAGYNPGTPPGGGVNPLLPLGPTVGPGSGTTVPPSPYAVGGLGYPGGADSAGGKTPGGAGSGAPGAGRQTGLRGPAEGAHGGQGPAGATRAGNRLQTGPAGMAPAAGRGKTEEDTEHKRKYGLDDRSLFTDEDGKTVDPVTGLPVAPPTIGA